MAKININIIERNITGTASFEEQEVLFAWLESNSANQYSYYRMKNIWDSSFVNSYTREDIHKEWQLLINRMENQKKKNRKTPINSRFFSFTPLLRYAAIFIFTIGLTWGIIHWQQSNNDIPDISYQQFIIPPGQRSQVVLSDGTKVWVNAATTLKYPIDFGENNRIVIVDGEATFDVVPTNKPFIVKTDNITITVLGTKFNVRGYSNENYVETALIKGSVKMSSEKEEIILKPGETASYLKENNKISIRKIPEIENKLSWNSNQLIFEGECLKDITRILERWFNVSITIAESELNEYKYTGKFVYNESIQQVLKVIAATTAIQYEINGSEIIISKEK